MSFSQVVSDHHAHLARLNYSRKRSAPPTTEYERDSIERDRWQALGEEAIKKQMEVNTRRWLRSKGFHNPTTPENYRCPKRESTRAKALRARLLL